MGHRLSVMAWRLKATMLIMRVFFFERILRSELISALEWTLILSLLILSIITPFASRLSFL